MTTIQKIQLGNDHIELDTIGLTDLELLKAAAEQFPHGMMVRGSNAGSVWVNPKLILNLASPDGFGIELVGFAHTGCELLRLAADPAKAELLGQQGCDRLIKMFTAAAKKMAAGSSANKIHAVRFGVGCKVVCSDRVEPGILELHPEGNVARRLMDAFKLHAADDRDSCDALERRRVLLLRHPFLFGGVLLIHFNDQLTKNTILVNREEYRRLVAGDADGDGICMLPLPENLADDLKREMTEAVPEMDPNLLVFGIASHDTEAGAWGENIFLDEKTTEKKLGQTFTKSIFEWIDSHKQMGHCANTLTPFAYRISDVCALMAGVGAKGAREAALIGGVVEETFYLSLAGGPDDLTQSLNLWMRNKLQSDVQQDVFFAGLVSEGKGVHHSLLAREDVKSVLLDGAAINREAHDPYDPHACVTHFGWLCGKGRTTTDPNALQKLRILRDLAGQPEGWELSKTFIGQMVFHAADKLTAILAITHEETEDDREYTEA